MTFNIKDLKKMLYDFNRISNRLLRANFTDYTSTVRKFVTFIKETPIIFEYIQSCGKHSGDLAKEFEEIEKSHGRKPFLIGDTENEEIRDVFAIINYIADHNVQVHLNIGRAYSLSNQYQDLVEAFNNRVVRILIDHIEAHLTKIGIDMGLDENKDYSITVENGSGQVNIVGDNATVTATNKVGLDVNELTALIDAVKECATNLPDDEREQLDDSLQTIQEEASSPQPRKHNLRLALSHLKTVKGSVELVAAISSLIQFVQIFFA